MNRRTVALAGTESLVITFELATAYLVLDAFGIPLFVALGAPVLGLCEAMWLESRERYEFVHPLTGAACIVLNVVLHSVHGWSVSAAVGAGLASGAVVATALLFPPVRKRLEESRSRRGAAAQ